MGRDPSDILIAVIVFATLLSYGVVEALSSAKNTILSTIISEMGGYDFGASLGGTIAIIILGAVFVLVFIAIPGRLGLFRILLGGR